MSMAENDRSSIVGVFADQSQAEQAVNELRTSGFSDDQINLVVHSANATDDDPLAGGYINQTGGTAPGIAPVTFGSKPGVTRTVVTVSAPGREQEALSILHRYGANNADVPDALESDLAPVLGTEAGTTVNQPRQEINARSSDSFFDAAGASNSPRSTGTPVEPGSWEKPDQ